MPSRKKKNGKERKAKKAEKERVDTRSRWQELARGESAGKKIIQCHHGFGDAMMMQDVGLPLPILNFIDDFLISWEKGAMNGMSLSNQSTVEIVENLMMTFESYPEVWFNSAYRKMAVDIFIRLGTNMLLSKQNLWS